MLQAVQNRFCGYPEYRVRLQLLERIRVSPELGWRFHQQRSWAMPVALRHNLARLAPKLRASLPLHFLLAYPFVLRSTPKVNLGENCLGGLSG